MSLVRTVLSKWSAGKAQQLGMRPPLLFSAKAPLPSHPKRLLIIYPRTLDPW